MGDMSDARILDGRYRLLREIAAGGMGVVHEAEHLSLKKRVAVKLLRREVAEVPGVAARFEREARATSLLDDPHIVRVTDFGRSEAGELYLVMELLQGASLGGVLAETPRLPPARALALVDQILAGLEVAHAHGLVHRDLKPDNVFISNGARGEHVRLLDFGIAAARRDADGTRLTAVGAVMGTPAYMSPEQATGRSDLDSRTDLYAVGTILYEMLAGRPAYHGENYNQILHAVVLGSCPPLSSLRSELPASLCAIVQRAMATAMDERYASAETFREALRNAHAPAFRMPDKLEITDLRGSMARLPRQPSGPVEPALFVAEDVAALELESSAAAAAGRAHGRAQALFGLAGGRARRLAHARRWRVLRVEAVHGTGGRDHRPHERAHGRAAFARWHADRRAPAGAADLE